MNERSNKSASTSPQKRVATGGHAKHSLNEGGERTRLRILGAAEKLFAAHGLDGTSMRDVAERAEIPLALVNYHFGSKDGLYRAVFKYRVEDIVRDRSARLKEIQNRTNPPPSVADIFDAMARPWIKLHQSPGGRAYAQLVAREIADPAEGDRGILQEFIDPFAHEFIQAFVSFDEKRPIRAHWAYHFFSGALILMLANPRRVQRLSDGLCNTNKGDEVLQMIVTFFADAFMVPNPETGARSSQKAKAKRKA